MPLLINAQKSLRLTVVYSAHMIENLADWSAGVAGGWCHAQLQPALMSMSGFGEITKPWL